MGGRLTRVGARQHPDLTPSPDDTRALRAVVLTLLTVDGIISAVLAAFFLPLRIGPVPFPISALLSGLLNAALVCSALQWTSSPRLAAAHDHKLFVGNDSSVRRLGRAVPHQGRLPNRTQRCRYETI